MPRLARRFAHLRRGLADGGDVGAEPVRGGGRLVRVAADLARRGPRRTCTAKRRRARASPRLAGWNVRFSRLISDVYSGPAGLLEYSG